MKHFSKFLIHVFFYIQHIVTRNKFTLFNPWKLETFTPLTVKENLITNLLRAIISSLVNKNYYYIVILFLQFVILFVSKDLLFPLLRWSMPEFWKIWKNWKIFQSILCQMDKYNLFLSTNILLCYVLTILIHHFVLFFSVLSQKNKFYV